MDQIQQLLAHPQADFVLLIVGGLLTLIGFIQVVRKGFALVFWLLLFAAGLLPVMYVFKGSDTSFLASTRDRVTDIGSLAPDIRDELLQGWCDKYDASGQ